MIALFKKNTTLQLVVILLLWAVMAGASLWRMQGAGFGAMAETVVAMLLIGLEGFWFNILLRNSRAVSHTTLLPMLLYVLAVASQPVSLSPMLFINLLLLLMLRLLLVWGDKPLLSDAALVSVSAVAAVCTLISPVAWVLLLYLVEVIVLFQLYTWRHWVLLLLGFLMPYLIWLFYHFLGGGLPEAWHNLTALPEGFSIRLLPTSVAGYVENGFFLLLLLAGWLYGSSLRSNRTEVANLNNALVMSFLLIGFLSLFHVSLLPVAQTCFAIPFAYIVSLLFLSVPKGWFWNLLLGLYIVASVTMPFL